MQKKNQAMLSKAQITKLRSKIKLLVLDVDGVLTDGGVYFTESGDEFKKFNVKDGLGIRRLTAKGIRVGFLSAGRTKKLIQRRADLLNVELVYVGMEEKLSILTQWKEQLNISFSEIAYVCDDVNDLECVKQCAFTACPSDASGTIKKSVTVVLEKKGGEGCVREFIERFFISI